MGQSLRLPLMAFRRRDCEKTTTEWFKNQIVACFCSFLNSQGPDSAGNGVQGKLCPWSHQFLEVWLPKKILVLWNGFGANSWALGLWIPDPEILRAQNILDIGDIWKAQKILNIWEIWKAHNILNIGDIWRAHTILGALSVPGFPSGWGILRHHGLGRGRFLLQVEFLFLYVFFLLPVWVGFWFNWNFAFVGIFCLVLFSFFLVGGGWGVFFFFSVFWGIFVLV